MAAVFISSAISMGENCVPLVADLFLFCYERDFMISLSNDDKADIIKAFNSTSRYKTIFLILLFQRNGQPNLSTWIATE